jgi:hypothetical protein
MAPCDLLCLVACGAKLAGAGDFLDLALERLIALAADAELLR